MNVSGAKYEVLCRAARICAEKRRAWCPPDQWKHYEKLRAIFGAQKAREMILGRDWLIVTSKFTSQMRGGNGETSSTV